MQDLRNLLFKKKFLKKCCQQMLSQNFIECYYYKIVLTYIFTPAVLEVLQISINHCINSFWSVTVYWQATANSYTFYYVKVLTVI